MNPDFLLSNYKHCSYIFEIDSELNDLIYLAKLQIFL